MCGISGYFAFAKPVHETSTLWAMTRAIAHRGPDGEGAAFIEARSGLITAVAGERTPLVPTTLPSASDRPQVEHTVALGHRRFAIIDLTTAGHQPLLAADGLFALSFQGEIYNHDELRTELIALGHTFQSRGDTEVLAHAWLEWGEHCLSRLRGFWALALWDGQLWLARDPIGKAPLYCARQGGRLWWSSEIKGVRAGAGQHAFTPRAAAVSDFVCSGLRDFGNKTFFEGIETFPAGSVACVQADGTFVPRRYWAPTATRLRASDISPDEAVAELTTRLEDAVRLRLRADVPVGVELSGGMDSSAIAALAARERGPSSPLAAFTVAFPGTVWDESPFARRVVDHYGDRMALTTLEHQSQATLASISDFHRALDEPFHSPVLVLNREIWARMAAAGIRVTLNGAGGDEVFAGYGHEYLGPFARGLFARGHVFQAFHELSSFSEREGNAARAWARAAWWMVPESWRLGLRPTTPGPALNPLKMQPSRFGTPTASDHFEQRLIDHLGDWKMNYWLRSGNTATMGVPIESRLPLLDTRVIEWATHLPGEYLIRDGWLKWPLRRALDPYLPHDVTWRKTKMGFPFPLAEWLRTVRPGLESLRHGDDPPGLDRAKVFASYDALATSHPAYLWRCLSVLMWWDRCVTPS
jgi:asparagine synthase (glutamine-hydrolysing)